MNIKDHMIASESHNLLDGLGHEAVGLYIAVERKLESVGAPDLSWRMETGETGILKAFAGKRRDFLCIEHDRLREYKVLISSRAYGSALHVSWLLLVTPRFANDLRRAVRLDAERGTRFDIGSELDYFDGLDLNAFMSLSHLALKTAIREITGAEGDPDDSWTIPGRPPDMSR